MDGCRRKGSKYLKKDAEDRYCKGRAFVFAKYPKQLKIQAKYNSILNMDVHIPAFKMCRFLTVYDFF